MQKINIINIKYKLYNSSRKVSRYILCLKNSAKLWNGIARNSRLWVDFDDIWQKYSKDSTIKFACFSFRVGLLFITLSFCRRQYVHRRHYLLPVFRKRLKTELFVRSYSCSVPWYYRGTQWPPFPQTESLTTQQLEIVVLWQICHNTICERSLNH